MASNTLRTISMPLGMVVGALLCRPITALDAAAQGMLTPVFIFTMLFFILPCRCTAHTLLVDAPVATAVPDSGVGGNILCVGVVRRGGGTGCNDMHPGSRSYGGGGDWWNARC